MPDAQTAIRQVRRFNRTVTEGIGVLDSHFMGRDRPVGEARILWEIGTEGVEVRALRARLGLDSGYISRVLRSLERHKLVRVRASGSDRRVRHVTLTGSGLAERAELDRLSDSLASRILEPLNEGQRARLLAAMKDIERLIEASLVKFAIEDPDTADARSCLDRYFAELDTRFDEGFDPSLSLPIRAEELTPPAGAFVIARLRGRPVGCGAVKCQPRASCARPPDVGVAGGARPWRRPAPAAGARAVRPGVRRERDPPRYPSEPDRSHRPVPARRVSRSLTVQRRTVWRPLVREAARGARVSSSPIAPH